MKKLSSVLMVAVLVVVAVISAGCGCSSTDSGSTQNITPSLNTNALDSQYGCRGCFAIWNLRQQNNAMS